VIVLGCVDSDDQAAVGHSVGPARWQAETDKLLDRMAGRFARVETRRRTRGFLLGLLSDLRGRTAGVSPSALATGIRTACNTCWGRASWDTDRVRNDPRDYVTGQLGDADAVLVVDETGDLKKGTATVGVQRQYTGTAGRIENAQVAVYLTYAAARGHAMIDRELYLPKSWTDDPQRCAAAGVPEHVGFLTKTALATGMLLRAINAAVPARWVAGDEVYGADPTLRAELEARRVGYALAIGCDRRIPTAAGLQRADQLAAVLPRRASQRLSAGSGAKGQRFYDWALITHPDPVGQVDSVDDQCWWLPVRRHRDADELAFYRCYSPNVVPLRELVRVAGRRWTVEESAASRWSRR
jgi:SRSO17 transposase